MASSSSPPATSAAEPASAPIVSEPIVTSLPAGRPPVSIATPVSNNGGQGSLLLSPRTSQALEELVTSEMEVDPISSRPNSPSSFRGPGILPGNPSRSQPFSFSTPAINRGPLDDLTSLVRQIPFLNGQSQAPPNPTFPSRPDDTRSFSPFNPSPVHQLTTQSSQSTQLETRIHATNVQAPREGIPAEFRLGDPKDLHIFSKFLYHVHATLMGGLYYSSMQETWIAQQLLPDSEAARNWQEYTDVLPFNYFVNSTRCRFPDLSALREAMVNCFYLRKNLCFPAEVIAYVNNLKINHREPAAPKSGVELINRASSVFSLLPVPDNVDIRTQIGYILQRLPVSQRERIVTDAVLRPELLNNMSTFRTFVEAMDNAFKNENVRKKKQESRPTRDNNNNEPRRPYRTFHPRSSDNRTGQTSNQVANDRDKRDFRPNRPQVPKEPFSGKCDHCGKPGHKIRDCFHAPQAVKDEWHRKFKENRLKRRTSDNNANDGKKTRPENKNQH